MTKHQKKAKVGKNRFAGFNLITDTESGLITFGTNVWVRKSPFGVIVVFPTGETLKILPEDEINSSPLNRKTK